MTLQSQDQSRSLYSRNVLFCKREIRHSVPRKVEKEREEGRENEREREGVREKERERTTTHNIK